MQSLYWKKKKRTSDLKSICHIIVWAVKECHVDFAYPRKKYGPETGETANRGEVARVRWDLLQNFAYSQLSIVPET